MKGEDSLMSHTHNFTQSTNSINRCKCFIDITGHPNSFTVGSTHTVRLRGGEDSYTWVLTPVGGKYIKIINNNEIAFVTAYAGSEPLLWAKDSNGGFITRRTIKILP